MLDVGPLKVIIVNHGKYYDQTPSKGSSQTQRNPNSIAGLNEISLWTVWFVLILFTLVKQLASDIAISSTSF